MSDDDITPPVSSSPMGLVTQSPLAFAVTLVGLYWIVKILRPADRSRPPRAPYWIPWVGSAMEMGQDPDGFFNNMSYVSHLHYTRLSESQKSQSAAWTGVPRQNTRPGDGVRDFAFGRCPCHLTLPFPHSRTTPSS